MDFTLQKVTHFLGGPAPDGTFDIGVLISRYQLGLVAEGSPREGRFVYLIPQPKFCRDEERLRALILFVDNIRMCKSSAALMYEDFTRYAQRKRAVPLTVTLDHERRIELYDKQYLQLSVADAETPGPWHQLSSLVLLYCENEDEAQALFTEIVQ